MFATQTSQLIVAMTGSFQEGSFASLSLCWPSTSAGYLQEHQEQVSDPEHDSQAESCPRPDIYQLFSQQLNPSLCSCAL